MSVKPRYKLVKEKLYVKKGKILDYGGGNGDFLAILSNSKYKKYCVDIIDKKKTSISSEIVYKNVIKTNRLPFRDGYFDAVTMLEVLEHVPDEKKTIAEVSRVMKKGSQLIITSPNQGLFSFADPGNIKFKFPVLHKTIYKIIYGNNKYLEEFENEKGRKGDISKRSVMEHHHYNDKELSVLLSDKFKIDSFFYFGLFFPFLGYISYIYEILFARESVLLNKIIDLDSRISIDWASFYMGVVATKK